ncbi:hypothetical protein [Rhodoferax sp.]|uniref:hypothetical protein n=1 Tax=Rhodoferax sp. TaxID=50421 RepID=UPI00275D8B82|nr:hypothetical protein [Rhodoferax sp.]
MGVLLTENSPGNTHLHPLLLWLNHIVRQWEKPLALFDEHAPNATAHRIDHIDPPANGVVLMGDGVVQSLADHPGIVLRTSVGNSVPGGK